MSFYRLTFVAGLAVGFIAGTRAGRERYDQMVQWAKTATESPAFQKAASTAQTQASGLISAAGQKVADRAPRVAQSAMNSVSDHVPLLKHRDSDGSSGKGSHNGPVSATGNSHRGSADS